LAGIPPGSNPQLFLNPSIDKGDALSCLPVFADQPGRIGLRIAVEKIPDKIYLPG